MEGEENKDGGKRRLKKCEISFDSDDNEPIGSLLKLKKPRNIKKLKQDKMTGDKAISVGMEDTLASYRKKLKGPKVNNRSLQSEILDTLIEDGSFQCGQLLDVSMDEDQDIPVKTRAIGSRFDLKHDTIDHGCSDATALDDVNEVKSYKSGQVASFCNDKVCIDSPSNDFQNHSLAYLCQDVGAKLNDATSVIEFGHFKAEAGPDLIAAMHVVESLNETNNDSFDVKSSYKCSVSGTQNSGSFTQAEDEKERLTVGYGEFLETVSEASASSLRSKFIEKDVKDRRLRESHVPIGTGNSTDCIFSVSIGNESCMALDTNYCMDEQKLKDQSGQQGAMSISREVDDAKKSETVSHDVAEFRRGNESYISQNCESLKLDGIMKSENFHHSHKEPPCMEQFLPFERRKDETEALNTFKDATSSPVEPNVRDVYNGYADNEIMSTSNCGKTDCNNGHSPFITEMLNSSKKCSSISNQKLLEHDGTESSFIQSHDSVSVEEAAYISPSGLPEENECFEDDAVSLLDYGSNKGRLLASERAVRRSRKRRIEGMAYEGDEDWDVLVNDRFLESDHDLYADKTFKSRERFEVSSAHETDTETGGAVAVTVGLKAHAPGPVEKIRFKEIFKRKGGLQEYIDRRNKILGLWGKDFTRILTLEDCDVVDTPCREETTHVSLTRDIFLFLDKGGYINFGVALNEEKARLMVAHGGTTFDVASLSCNQPSTVACVEDEISVRGCQASISEDSMDFRGEFAVGTEKPLKPVEGCGQIPPFGLEFPRNLVESNDKVEMREENDLLGNVGQVSLDNTCTLSSCPIADTRPQPVKALDSTNVCQLVHPCMKMEPERNEDYHHRTATTKTIVIIGAGPAGLSAARHLQRQGFCVTVLEARNRIGGRVYTDRTSLSVPVDLGASIITGVEADVATERRPDPSSLICSQLGLELTVLNSDCPLYDIVTGEKVPNELDEAIEEEYNSLLDDMVLLVAQRGEQAMKMSLEDGLEYALKRRRMARSRVDSHGNLHGVRDMSRASKDCEIESGNLFTECSEQEILSSMERRVMDWHYAHLEYGCAALLKEVSLPYWNQDDVYGGFGGAHCMIKGGYSNVVESLAKGLNIHLNHVVTEISYSMKEYESSEMLSSVMIDTSNGSKFFADAVLVTVPLGCLKAEAIKFSPSLPQWKQSSIQRLGFGVLNKVVLEFPSIFWDDSVDYFGATADETEQRGHCFMFWNVKKTVGAPVLIALVVGKAAVEGQALSSTDHVNHALKVLRKLFGNESVPEPVASVVTDWGRDPFSYGAYSYVAIGSSGEDYDILGRPVGNCIFFAGEATCKEHPDTVGGAMMSGLREAVRMMNLLNTGHDYSAEVEAMEAAERHSECERDEVRDITKRLEAVDLSNAFYKSSLEGGRILTREGLLRDMFYITKTTAGRLLLAKKLLNLPVETLKSFAGSKKGLSTLNSWILDSLGKDATQLLRHCVRLLVRVSTNLLAVRLSGIGKTVKDKVCVHTSRDIRAIASQLVNMWLQVFRRDKALNSHRLLSKKGNVDSGKSRFPGNQVSGKPPLRSHYDSTEHKGSPQVHEFSENSSPFDTNFKKTSGKIITGDTSKQSSKSYSSPGRSDPEFDRGDYYTMSQEEQAAFAAAEAACAAARAAAEAYASAETKRNALLQLPKIPSFNKFARREQYAQTDEHDYKKKWYGGVLGRQDCLSDIDSRNCRVRDWSIDFSAPCDILESVGMSADNLSHHNHSNEIASQLNLREQSGESANADCNLFTKAWVDTAGSEGLKDYLAIERWQSQAAAADLEFRISGTHVNDEEDSNASTKPVKSKKHSGTREFHRTAHRNHARGVDRIKQAVVDFVASLLMPVYKARKIDREGYKSIMKKCATKVVELATDAEKNMAVSEFLDSKRKNKIRAFIDKLIERHMESKASITS